MEPQVLETLVLIVHVLASLGIIGLVLIQHGKGADMGSGFGGGASGTVFGAAGAGNFLTKTTTWLAIAFFVTSFSLAYFAKEKSVMARDLGIPQVVDQIQVDVDTEIPLLTEDNVVPAGSDSEIPQLDDDDAGEIPDAN